MRIETGFILLIALAICLPIGLILYAMLVKKKKALPLWVLAACLLLASIPLAILGEHDCVYLCIALSFIVWCVGFAVSLKNS